MSPAPGDSIPGAPLLPELARGQKRSRRRELVRNLVALAVGAVLGALSAVVAGLL